MPLPGVLYKLPSSTGQEAPWTKPCLKNLGFPEGRTGDFTFFTVMAVFMQHEAISALAHIAPKGVDTFVLATTIVFGAFVLVWAGSNQQTLSWQGYRLPQSPAESPIPRLAHSSANLQLYCWISPAIFLAQILFSSTALHSIKCITNVFYFIM